ncbi:hypothetical protein GGR51DRAFT_575246 [Nemania sp. FL0031]|nr:hypothetical protein GGR51DRAFT_575246 [Nemania sp. FL0031]
MGSSLPPSLIDQLRNGPAAAPPHGVVPNYHDPPNQNKLAVGVIIASITITSLAGLIRFYSKVFCTGIPFFIAGTWVLTTIPSRAGFFVHQWDLLVKDLEGFLFSYVLSTTLYCVAMLLAKAAILLEWIHIFVARPNRNTFFWICSGMIMANTALYIATIITTNFACTPRERIWRRYIPGSCINIDAFNVFITVFHLIFDLLMLLLPQIAIWKLSLTTRQKTGISIVFSVGAVACAWAAGRVVSAVELSKSQDKSYRYSQYIMWGLAEVATAQLVFCVPSFPLIFRQPNLPHRLLSYLGSKITMILFPERLSSNTTLSHLQSTTEPEPTLEPICTWFDDGSDTGLTELQPIRIQGGRYLERGM